MCISLGSVGEKELVLGISEGVSYRTWGSLGMERLRSQVGWGDSHPWQEATATLEAEGQEEVVPWIPGAGAT